MTKKLKNYAYGYTDDLVDDLCMPISYFTTHCRWIPTAAYHQYNAETVNSQIISISGHHKPFNAHHRICVCSSDGKYNCSIDVMGTVYPGQMLRVSMSLPENKKLPVVRSRMFNTLPGCTVTHPHEWLYIK